MSVTSGILTMESTALIHLVVMLSYPGALPVGSRFIMSSMSFSVVVLKVNISSPMSHTWLSMVVKLGWLSMLSIYGESFPMSLATLVKYVLKASATSEGSVSICPFTSSCMVSCCLPFFTEIRLDSAPKFF